MKSAQTQPTDRLLRQNRTTALWNNQEQPGTACAGLNKGLSLRWGTTGNPELFEDRCSNLADVTTTGSTVCKKPLQDQPYKHATPWLDFPPLRFLLSLLCSGCSAWIFFLKWWNIDLVVCITLIALETTFCSTSGHRRGIFLSLIS